MARAGLRQQDHDAFAWLFMPGFLLLLGYLILDPAVSPVFGFPWKAGYVGVFATVMLLLGRKVFRTWGLTRGERTKFFEGFLAGSATVFVVAASRAAEPAITGSPNPPVDPIWVVVGLLVFGFAGGYWYSGVWKVSGPGSRAP